MERPGGDRGTGGDIPFEIYTESRARHSLEKSLALEASRNVHCQGIARLVVSRKPSSVDLSALQADTGQRHIHAKQCYTAFKTMGIDFGPAHQGIERMGLGNGQVLAELCLPPSVTENLEDYVLHPALVDAALQASIGLGMPDEASVDLPQRPFLPFALEELQVHGPCTEKMWAWVRYSRGSTPSDTIRKLDIDLVDDQGNLCAGIRGFSSREFQGQAPSSEAPLPGSVDTLIWEPGWKEEPPVEGRAMPDDSGRLILVCGLAHISSLFYRIPHQGRCVHGVQWGGIRPWGRISRGGP